MSSKKKVVTEYAGVDYGDIPSAVVMLTATNKSDRKLFKRISK
jgi:hypothetical protein